MKSITQIAGTILLLFSAGSATAVAGTTYDECIYALSSSAAGALSMSGSVDVNAASNCGVIVDSSSTSALAISGSAKLTAKYIDIVGGYARSGSATLTPNPQTNIASQPNPLTFLVPPTYSQCTYTNFSISGSTSTTVNPGTYCNGIKISGSANVTFNSGTYILVGGGLSVSGSGTLTGSDLTFYLTKNSTYNYGALSVSGSAALNFSAPTSVSSPYYGILFYQDPSITNGSASSISGSSDSTLEGVFYFPTTSLSYSGSSRAGNYLIIVANTLILTGSVDINGNYPNLRSPLEPPVSVSLSPPSAVLYPSQTQQFAATINNSSEGVTWSLSPSDLGTIGNTGLYTAPSTIASQETVTVTATSQEDPTKSTSATITLLPPISVSVAPPTVALQGGQSQLFAGTVVNTSNTGVLWTINPAVGTITTGGLYTAPAIVSAQQTVTVTATSVVDTTKWSAAVVTLVPISVTVGPPSVTLYGNGTQQFTATVSYTTNTGVNWTISPSIGSVSNTGLYTAPASVTAPQSITITATSQADGTKSASATINLSPPVSVSVTPTTATVAAGATEQLSAAVQYSSNTAVNWTINPATGAGTISSNGLYAAPASVTAQQTVTITATSQASSAATASATITLTPSGITITPSTVTLSSGQTQQFTASVGVTWSISPSNVGSIDSTGLYTAPSCIDTGQTITVTVTSTSNSSQTTTATITLTASNNNGYGYRRTIAINHAQVSNTDQTNFPVLINVTDPTLASTSNNGHVASSSGYDIIFTSDATCQTALPYEREVWNAATGQLTIWVQVPDVSASSDTPIYLCYGNPSITSDQSNPAGVWDSNYVAVWHLGDGTTLNANDSTSNGNNGAIENAVPVAGKIGGAASFNGTDAYITIPSAAFESIGSSPARITFEAWYETSSPTGVLLGYQTGTPGAMGGAAPSGAANSLLDFSSSQVEGSFYVLDPNGFDFATAPNNYSNGNWTQIVDAYPGFFDHLYTNGASPNSGGGGGGLESRPSQLLNLDSGGSTPALASPTGKDFISTLTFQLGAGYTRLNSSYGWYYFNGVIDEMRISSTARSSDWIATEYNNINSPATFYTMYPENTTIVDISPLSVTLTNGGTQQFTGAAFGTCNSAVTWTITPAGAGTIDNTGLYTVPANLVASQTVTVTAASVSNPSITASATVNLVPTVTVSVSPQTSSIGSSATQQFTATVTGATNTAVTWSLSPAGIGSIDANGVYTSPACAFGAVTVTATSVENPSASASTIIAFAGSSGAGGYNFQHVVVINHTKVPNIDQTNFPVAISVTDPTLAQTTNGGHVTSPNGYDIAVTSDASCLVPLNYEIEQWNASTGALVVWAQIPSLSHTSDTTVYLCYGNPAITAQTNNPSATWDTNYSGVWHLSTDYGQQQLANDSTTNGNSGSGYSSVNDVPGKIGDGAGFVSYSNAISTSTNAFPSGAGPRTTSIWFNATTARAALYAFGSSTGALFGDFLEGGRLWPLTTANVPDNTLETTSLTAENQWYYLAQTYDGTTLTTYLNGAQVFSQAVAFNTATSLSTIGGSVGSDYYTFNNYIAGMQGTLDEYRVSTIVRSPDWIATEYNNQNSPSTFYTFYPEDGLAVAISPANVTLFNSQSQQFTASAAGNCSSGVTWSLTPASAGTLTSSGLYTAPATIAAPQTVTVTATSVSSPTQSASSTVSLIALGTITVAPQTGTLAAAQTLQFTATVANANPAVTWSITPSGLGSIDANGLYTAPSCVTSQQTVTITATSVAVPTLSASVTLTLYNTNGYGFRRAIIIGHTNIPNTDQANFPFLFNTTDPTLANIAQGGHVNSASGYDILFSSDPYGFSPLNFELDTYNPATGQLTAWVNIPALSHTTDTVIYLFYGNPAVTTPQANVSGTWDINYVGVYHFGNGTTLSANDSSQYGNSGTNVGATAAAGIIGGGANFQVAQNASTLLDLGDADSLIPANAVTISGWFNSNQVQPVINGSNGYLITKDSTYYYDGYTLGLEGRANNTLRFQIFDEDAQVHNVSSTVGGLNDGNWHYAVGTFDGSNVNLYLDGALNASIPVTGQIGWGETHLVFGNGFAGTMDETRISSIARSADWIAAEYANQNSPSTFYTLYPENTVNLYVSPAALTLYQTQTLQLTSGVLGGCNVPVTWSLSPANIGAISSTGLYTAPASIASRESVTVTATDQVDTTQTASATIMLLPAASVSIMPSTASLYGGQTQQFLTSVNNVDNSQVTWSVSPSGAGTVDTNGLYTAAASITAVQTITVTATSVADTTKSASATVTLLPGQGSATATSAFGNAINLITQALCRQPHTAPVVSAGADQTTVLNCPSGQPPCSASVSLSGVAVSYTLNPGDSLSYAWSLLTGPAPVQFTTPNAANAGVTFTAPGYYTLQLSISDSVTSGAGVTHVAVNLPLNYDVGNLWITPSASGPNAVNTSVTLQASGGQSGYNFMFQVTGANPQTITSSTGTFTYTGFNAGTDMVTATVNAYWGPLQSNTVPVTWVTTTTSLTTSPVAGQFFTADGTGVFNTPATQMPLFTQTFPNIDFNPAAGSVTGNTSSVTNQTRPFTDVVTTASGTYVGTLPAQQDPYQAGVGPLYNFSAVYTGSFNVPAAGPVTFTFTSDDGFIFGVGNNATAASGPQTNTPAATPFQSYPVMGGVNQRMSPSPVAITVNFPAGGTYPYEVDYAKGQDNQLTLSMTSGGIPIPAANLLTLAPGQVPSISAGQIEQLTLAAQQANGTVLPNLPATVSVTGINQQSRPETTDGTGQAGFAYQGLPFVGSDLVQASAFVNGATIYSNVVAVQWNSGTNQAPVVSAGSAQTINLPYPAILNGSVTDDGLPNNTLTITWSTLSGPGPVTFDNPNQAAAAASFTVPGTYVLQLSAFDGALTTTATVTITVNANPNIPTGWLLNPMDGSTVSGEVPITLIPGITLTSGTLTYFPSTSPQSAVTLSANTTGSGQIATLDATLLNNGGYFILLNATNSQGVTQTSQAYVTVVGDYKPGRVTATITDLTVPAPGLPIQIQRTYDSLVRSASSDFGYGWKLGVNIQTQVSPTGDVTLTINGRSRTFFFTPPANAVFTYWYTPQYTPEPGLYGSLVNTGDNCSGLLVHIGNVYQCAISNADQLYQATGYQYTDPSGRVYTLASDGTLQSVQDLNGNTITITSAGIISSSGPSVPFVRDSQGRITQITDPMGNQYLYGYDANGNLTSVTYPSVSTPAQYQYDSTHLLTQETDQRGNVAGTSTYYPDGTLQSVTDAVGNITQYAYNTAINTTTVTNPDGGTVVTVADSYGDPLTVTDPLGRTTTNTYDVNHNLLTVTDPLGNITTYTYNSNGFQTSKTDPLGDIGTLVYNAFGDPTSWSDPLGNTIAGVYNSQAQPTTLIDGLGELAAVAYDAVGNITSLTDAGGSTNTFTYDAQGDRLTSTDALGRITTNTYDSLGNVLSSKDPRGNITQNTYDALGHLTQSIDATGKVTTYGYDGNGNRTSTLDPLQNRTSYTYDAANRLTQTTFPDGTTAGTSYDWRGNILTQTDQAGRVTQYTYDLADQVTSVTTALGTADASTVSFAYDSDGRKLTDTDALGNVKSYAYDAAGRLLNLTTLAGAISFTYDADSHRISTTDPKNHTTQNSYDARGRLIKTTFADGSTTTSTYDGYGRPLARTDQAGNVTTRAYDAAGQLVSITDALNHTTQYAYDGSGNQTSQTDPNQHTTTDSYNALNQFVGRTWPAGGAASQISYDADRNMLSSTDNNGKTTTYSYDPLNRLLQEAPDASLNDTAVTFAYTSTGRRASMTDASGTTAYTYDNQDRLIGKASPRGTLTYTYDTNSNVLSVQSSNVNGISLTYSYDALNRLASVTDKRLPAGQNTTTYSYDAASNVVTATYPNGVQQMLTYDPLNRVAQSIAGSYSYAYNRAPTGGILSVAEGSGRSATYNYDNAWRLTNEAVAGDPANHNGSLAYSLDPVTNRLSLNSSLSGLASQTFTFNANDQTTIEAYDANGNLLSSAVNTYVWDFANRLKSFNNGTVTMVYDGDSNRVAKTTSSGTTRYLVDDLNPTGYPQVVEELSGGAVQRVYTYGQQRISEMQMSNGLWTPSWYGYDGDGHVRVLTNPTGSITDTYDYDAYGNLIGATGSTPNVYLYRGEQFDPDLGLYYLRARWYNPVTGRFLSRDPLDKGNKYTYAGSDPVNASDPRGLDAEGAAIQLEEDVFAAPALVETSEEVVCDLQEVAGLLQVVVRNLLDNGHYYLPVVLPGLCTVVDVRIPRRHLPPHPPNPPQPPQPQTCAIGQCKEHVERNRRPGDKVITYTTTNPAKNCGALGENIFADQLNMTPIATNGFHTGILRDGMVYDNIYPYGISLDDWQDSVYYVALSCTPNQTKLGTFLDAQNLGIGEIVLGP